MNTSRIDALRKTKLEIDAMIERINATCEANEVEIKETVLNRRKEIEDDLEEIYDITDPSVEGTRQIVINDHTDKRLEITFDIDNETHILIRNHFWDYTYKNWFGDIIYRNGFVEDSDVEWFVSNWDEYKEEILKAIEDAYKKDQEERLQEAMAKLEDTEKRLSKATGKNRKEK